MFAYSKDIIGLINFLVFKQYDICYEMIKKSQKTFLDSIGVNLSNVPADLKCDLAKRQELNEDSSIMNLFLIYLIACIF